MHGGVREVELVEEAPDEARRAARRHGGVWRRWWPVPVLVVGLVVAAQAILDARARRHDAFLASLPGTIAPVPERLDVRWEVSTQDQPVVAAGFEVGGAFVGARRMGDGSFDALALDTGTGAVRWATALQAASDARASAASPVCVGTRATTPTASPSSTAARTDARTAADAVGTGTALVCAVPFSAQAARLVTVDAADGSVLASVAVPRTDALAVDGATTYLAARTDNGTCAVRAVVDGTSRWVTVVRCGAGARLLAAGGQVAVGASTDGWTTVLASDGRVVAAVDGSTTTAAVGDLIVTSTSVGGKVRSRVYAAGREPVAVAGTVMVPQVDDGSAAGVVVTADRESRGYDAATGRLLWRVPLALSGAYLVRDGRIVSSSSQDLVVEIDAHSGKVRHRAAVQRDALAMTPMTDGPRYFTVVLGAPSDPARLIGIDAAAGQGVTQVGTPVGLLSLRQVGRHLVGSDAAGVVSVLG